MKSKDLIKLLQEEDPTGEEEVVIGNSDICSVASLPGYYDGSYSLLVKDESGDIIGAEYRSDGSKLCIYTMDWYDVLSDIPDAPIKVVDVFTHKKMQEAVDKGRAEIKSIHAKFEAESLKSVIEKLNDGWVIRQKDSDPITKCHYQHFYKKGLIFQKIEKLNQGQCIVVVLRDKFDAIKENDGFIYWRLK